MEILEYKLKTGDTLESIAKEHGVGVKELLDFHNSKATMPQQFFGEVIPLHIKNLIIKKNGTDSKEKSVIPTGSSKITYRTEQFNITRIEDEVKSYSHLKKEYDVVPNLNQYKCGIQLKDFFYEFNPPALSRVFDFVSEVEYIRNSCQIKLDDLGRFCEILNKDKLMHSWLNFKKEKLEEIEFIKIIKQTKPFEYKNLLQKGDLQFSDQYDDKNDFDRDLFYLSIFDKYLYNSDENLTSENYNYQSQLFPNVVVPMRVRYDLIKKEHDLITFRKVFETIESEDLLKKVTEGYEKYHRPLIKYRFSSYKLDMRNLFTYNVKNKILEKAEFTIIENIENNIKSECIYNIKKLEN